jgi:hypothetical protein
MNDAIADANGAILDRWSRDGQNDARAQESSSAHFKLDLFGTTENTGDTEKKMKETSLHPNLCALCVLCG